MFCSHQLDRFVADIRLVDTVLMMCHHEWHPYGQKHHRVSSLSLNLYLNGRNDSAVHWSFCVVLIRWSCVPHMCFIAFVCVIIWSNLIKLHYRLLQKLHRLSAWIPVKFVILFFKLDFLQCAGVLKRETTRNESFTRCATVHFSLE